MRRLVAALALFAVAALAAFAPSAGAQTEEAVIGVTERGYDLRFSPDRLEVKPGAEVTFHPERLFAHTVTSVDGAFDSGKAAPGERRTFEAPSENGEYAFVCSFHPQMTGVLVVTGTPEEPEEAARSTPGAPLVALLAALGVVALLARRRGGA